MLNILVLIVGLFVVVFTEHFLFSLLAFSVYALVAANMFNRASQFPFYTFLIVCGVVLDVTIHQPLGIHLLAVSISLFLLWLMGIIVPIESKMSRYFSLSLFFLTFYSVYFLLGSLVQYSVIPFLTVEILVKMFVSILISIVLTFLFDSFFFSVRDSKNFDKLRLK